MTEGGFSFLPSIRAATLPPPTLSGTPDILYGAQMGLSFVVCLSVVTSKRRVYSEYIRKLKNTFLSHIVNVLAIFFFFSCLFLIFIYFLLVGG